MLREEARVEVWIWRVVGSGDCVEGFGVEVRYEGEEPGDRDGIKGVGVGHRCGGGEGNVRIEVRRRGAALVKFLALYLAVVAIIGDGAVLRVRIFGW